ncbi:MAG: hypothetical protein IPL01_17840 [Acidobacteria bacterium]|nr:hypothetical protein [Acidobacteriota bacterium]MBK9707215.1 hypothetical protein [Acidobacteriota bacterium]
MSRFDDELKVALRSEEPSAGFTERLMARVDDLQSTRQQNNQKIREKRSVLRMILELFNPGQVSWAMASALAGLMVFSAFGVIRYRENQRLLLEAAQGEAAKEQLIFAMKIASEKLNVAQKRVQATVDHPSVR